MSKLDLRLCVDHQTLQLQIKAPGEKRLLYVDTIKGLATASEKDLLEALIPLHFRQLGILPGSSRATLEPLPVVVIGPDATGLLLKKLTFVGSVTINGQKCKVDPFTKLSLRFIATRLEDKLMIQGFCVFPDKIVPLSADATVLPGNPCLLFSEGTLFALKPDLQWKWLELIFSSLGLIEGKKKERIEDLFEEGSFQGAPEFVFVSAQQEVSSVVSPEPKLMLKDRYGLFADLVFDYQGASCRVKEEELFWEKELLSTGYVKKGGEYYCVSDKVAKSLSCLLEAGWQVFDYAQRRLIKQNALDLHLTRKERKVYMVGSIDFAGHKVDLNDVVGSFLRKDQFVLLNQQEVGLVDYATLPSLEEVQVKDGQAFFEACHALSLEDQRVELGKQERMHNLFPQDYALVEKSQAGEGFQGMLFPYQQKGLAWLNFLYEYGFGGILADEMGLGKTVQILAFFSQHHFSAGALIVVPTSLIHQWVKEAAQFIPDIPLYVHHGKDRGELPQEAIIITSYALLHRDFSLFAEKKFDLIVLDEAQFIKNPDAMTAKDCFALQAKMKLAVTGTPIENAAQDLWSIFHFLMPELLKSRKVFASMLGLKAKIAPFLLRRKKDEVGLDLPPKYVQTVWVDMGDEQRQAYDEMLKKTRKELEQGLSNKLAIFEKLLRLRQICCDPALFDPDKPIPSRKLERLLEDLQEIVARAEKAIVYSQFTSMLQIIAKKLQDLGICFVYLDGQTKNREEVINTFQKDERVPIFLISLKAGGVGINLSRADYVCIYDPWWNEAVEAQAIDRAHRHGRKGPVIARRYCMIETIEERMLKLKELKMRLSQELLDSQNWENQVSQEELLQLFF